MTDPITSDTTPDTSLEGSPRFRGRDRIHGLLAVILVCASFLVVGLIVLDDYGVSWDEGTQHEIGRMAAHNILGNDYPLESEDDRFYGVAFELPLLLVEKMLGLEDSRNIYLSRHLLTHLFFLVGAFFCSLLVYRMFNNRLLALFTAPLFLLHPRLYAHSFFNTKDLPFLSMFMLALYLLHRAFRRDTIWAFLLCGVGVGILINIRTMGVMLFAAVLIMRTLDLFYAAGREKRKHILVTSGVFMLGGMATVYVTWPLLWSNPLRFLEAVRVASSRIGSDYVVFQGKFHLGTELPVHYLPTWISITTPPVMLFLGLIGTIAVLYRGLKSPGNALRNNAVRFQLLLLACLVLPILAVATFKFNLYNGWRHMYFLYGPLCLLGVLGLHWLVSTIRPKFLRVGTYALVLAGMAVVVAEMILIHPHQMVYFNRFVDRNTPEHLYSQYEFEYWGASQREALEYLLARYPASPIYVRSDPNGHARRNRLILPKSDRQRIIISDERVDFLINSRITSLIYPRESTGSLLPTIYSPTVFNNSIFTVHTFILDEPVIDKYREIYGATVSQQPDIRSHFNLYLNDNILTYIKDPCSPTDTLGRFSLQIFPSDTINLAMPRRKYGFNDMSFGFVDFGVRLDGKCLIQRELPEYDIDMIRTGQRVQRIGQPVRRRNAIWQAELTPRRSNVESTVSPVRLP